MIVFESDGERRIGAKERNNQIIPGIGELPKREAEVGWLQPTRCWLSLPAFLLRCRKWSTERCTPLRGKEKFGERAYDSWDTELSQTWPKFTVISGPQLGLKTKLLKRMRSLLPGSFRSADGTDLPCQLSSLQLEYSSCKPNAYLRHELGFQLKWLRFLS